MQTPHAQTCHGRAVAFAAGLALVGSFVFPVAAQQAAERCRITGKATSATTPLPGVSILVRNGDQVVGATSTAFDGSFTVNVPSNAVYRLTADLTAFGRFEEEFTVAAPPCGLTRDFEMTLASRLAGTAGTTGTTGTTGTAGTTGTTGTVPTAARGAGPGQRFQTLDVQADANADVGLQVNPPDQEALLAATQLLLPPGFSMDGPTEAVAMNGNMANVDRGALRNRLDAIGTGEIDPITGQFRQLAAADQAGGFGDEFGQFGQQGGRGGGRGGAAGRGGGRGGAGGRLGGRGIQQSPYSFTSNYTYGGSILDSAPYQLREDSPNTQQPYNRNNFSVTAGGPLKLPGIYDGTNKTNFNLSYTGNRSTNLFEQYATVPDAALRAGDFSASTTAVIDPATGVPFPGNQIPADRINPGSTVLLDYIPLPNLPGDTRNYYSTTTRNTTADSINLRLTHTLVGTARGGGRGGGGGRAGGGGRGGRGGLSVSVTGQVQYRRNESEQANVFPALGGQTTGSSWSVPIGVNIQRGRVQHAINLNMVRSTSESTNQYAYVSDVAGQAGLGGVSDDPFDYGVPNLSFSTFTNLRDTSPTVRNDSRLTLSYTLVKPAGLHSLRLGADYSQDRSSTRSNSNARGSLVFTGLYTANRPNIPRDGALDFADFLLGMPQQATIDYGAGIVDLEGKAVTAYFEDNWRKAGNLTFNLGVRYEYLRPYTEFNGEMVNLDVTDDFSAVSPVISGQTGLFSGVFPAALVNGDSNNVAPRVGVAYRVRQGTILRAGYGVSYNSGSYSSIARQLTGQPPFAVTNTSVGDLDDALLWDDPFALATPDVTTNNYGIDLDYVLGLIETYNVDVSQDIGVWNFGAGFIGTRGSDLDMLRAPNRGPDGLLLDDVQAFTWQTAEGRSILKAGTFRFRRRPVNGVGFGATYTLARSMDDTTATGGGATVAQDDQNLAAEYALSSFDRRHQFAADVSFELPFGPNSRWVNGGGFWSSVLDGWRGSANFTWQSGTPNTPTVSGGNVAQGVNGTLRANYDGDRIQVADPTIDAYFNTSAFSVPAAGEFGSASRNLIIGPGSRSLNANFSRDVRLGGNRTVTINLRANNLLNLVNYTGINTRVNSPTFGQVTNVSGMRSMQLNLRFRF